MRTLKANFKRYDQRVNGRWEDTPHFEERELNFEDYDIDFLRDYCDELAEKFADKYKTEIRWEFEEIGQGHYVGTLYKFFK